MTNSIKIATNQDFQAIAAVEAIKTLAEKNGIDALELMKEFVSGKNEPLMKEVAKMVIFAADITAAAL